MKRPWMPLYVGDYLANTGHLTTLQHGAYLLLIMHYWVKGGLPNDDRQLMAIARMDEEQWRGNCQVLATFFASGWRHSRIDEELAKVRSVSEKRAIAGLKGAWSKHGKGVANAKQMPTHSHSHIERGPSPQRIAQAEMLRSLLAPKAGDKALVASPELISSLRRKAAS